MRLRRIGKKNSIESLTESDLRTLRLALEDYHNKVKEEWQRAAITKGGSNWTYKEASRAWQLKNKLDRYCEFLRKQLYYTRKRS